MIKEYRIWNHGSNQGHYMTGDSPKEVVLHFLMGSDRHDFPIHAILWKTAKDLGLLKMTEQAKKFRDYHGEDKYTKYGRKYYKKDLYPKELKKKPFSSLSEDEYKKRYKTLKTFLKTGK